MHFSPLACASFSSEKSRKKKRLNQDARYTLDQSAYTLPLFQPKWSKFVKNIEKIAIEKFAYKIIFLFIYLQ